ncbi:helix-turn-helix transcriptional regulator, partial [Streptococcus pneumoniae]|nr:helix-turn-helix transcriptional regulator [Streptococcus pneumoniae]
MSTLAEKFRLKRKELRLSQQTLAEGICEQSQISKIERGHFIPSADLLFKLSQRLEVPLDYFFNEQIEIKSNLSNFKQLSARLLDDRNYDDLEYIYRIEIERSTFLTLEDRTYLEWIKAIITLLFTIGLLLRCFLFFFFFKEHGNHRDIHRT